MSGGMSFLPLLLIMGGMMFFMNRSQKKQQNKRQELINSVKPGSEVITIGGLYGVVHEVNEDRGTITLDCEGIYLEFESAAIKTVKPLSAAVTETEAEVIETNDDVEEEVVEEEKENQ